MFASDHTTPSEQRPAPPRAASPRITVRPVQPPLPPDPGPSASPSTSGKAATAPTTAPTSARSTPAGAANAAVDSRAPARLRALPSWLLSQASAAAARLVDDALAADGLRRQDFRVLVALDEAGAASQADVGRAVWLDRSDLHGVVTELESRGFLARARDPADRRRNTVTLTPEGHATLASLNARIDQAQDLFLSELSASDRATLIRLLRSLVPEAQPGGAS